MNVYSCFFLLFLLIFLPFSLVYLKNGLYLNVESNVFRGKVSFSTMHAIHERETVLNLLLYVGEKRGR